MGFAVRMGGGGGGALAAAWPPAWAGLVMMVAMVAAVVGLALDVELAETARQWALEEEAAAGFGRAAAAAGQLVESCRQATKAVAEVELLARSGAVRGQSSRAATPPAVFGSRRIDGLICRAQLCQSAAVRSPGWSNNVATGWQPAAKLCAR